jgi:hypothetical protein
MSRTTKLLILLGVAVALIVIASAARATNSCPGAMQIARSTSCVQEMGTVCPASGWNERQVMYDNGDGTLLVQIVYDPKCLDAPIPCKIASRMVAVTVDCTAKTATCM